MILSKQKKNNRYSIARKYQTTEPVSSWYLPVSYITPSPGKQNKYQTMFAENHFSAIHWTLHSCAKYWLYYLFAINCPKFKDRDNFITIGTFILFIFEIFFVNSWLFLLVVCVLFSFIAYIRQPLDHIVRGYFASTKYPW